MPARIAGLVLRASDKQVTAAFYTRLGLLLREHEHGGPKHFEVKPLSLDFVIELYQGSKSYDADALMVEVDSLEDAVRICRDFGSFPSAEVRQTDTTRFVYVRDPDGRPIMLIEQKK